MGSQLEIVVSVARSRLPRRCIDSFAPLAAQRTHACTEQMFGRENHRKKNEQTSDNSKTYLFSIIANERQKKAKFLLLDTSRWVRRSLVDVVGECSAQFTVLLAKTYEQPKPGVMITLESVAAVGWVWVAVCRRKDGLFIIF